MLSRLHWTPKPETERKRKKLRITKDKRRLLVEAAALILAEGTPTKFALEADCRHGLRQHLCLDGWSWHEAETAAKEIVDAALNRIGAYRPSWKEGQPEYTQDGVVVFERTRCIRCGWKLPEGHHKYCSSICAKNHHAAMSRLHEREAMNARVRAWYAAWSAKQPEQPCEQCGQKFRPSRPGRRFCSKVCANRHNSAMTRRPC